MVGLKFGVLGELRMLRRGNPQPLPSGKPRRLLATLLLHPNQFVSTDVLVDAIWDGRPPRSALANVRTYVRTLRAEIDDAKTSLETRPSGYRITLADGALDAAELAAGVAEATRLRQAGDDAAAFAAFERAHGLWRGRPLSDLAPTPAWDGAIARLESLHRTALDELIAIHLAGADHAAAADLLRARLTDEPYDEDLWCQLVECTLATGRRHQAEVTYAEAVRTLTNELGVEPGAALRAVGTRIGRPRVHPAERAVPRQLPLDVPDFTGRERELAQLADIVGGPGGRPAVAVVFGAPGTGKSTLAVHCGHQVRDAFPDGQIHLDMRATSRRRDPTGALFALLVSLGVPDLSIPQDMDRRAALLRSELADRRVLIILDDVESAAQVSALLPGTGTTALIITSRRRLSDLDGATRIRLDVMGDEQGARLLHAAASDKVVPGDRATAEIVRACGNLPLAIRIAAGRLAQRSDLTPAGLARRLRDKRGRLAELRIADLAVGSSADLSYRSLGKVEARLYRLIGLLGAVDFPAWALGAVVPGHSAERCLDTMIEANLVQVTGVDRAGTTRYRMHDLLRLHAGEWARRHGRQARADLATVLGAALARVRVASHLLPARFFGAWEFTDPPAAPPPGGPLRTADDAVTWHELAQPNLIPLLHAAHEQGLHELVWRLGAAWTPFFDLRGYFDAWQEVADMALDCARASGSAHGEATILCGLAQLGLYRDEWDASREHFTTARRLFRDLDLPAGVGVAAAGLSSWHNARDEPEAAMPWAKEALTAFVVAGDRRGEAVARTAIGTTLLAGGDLAGAWTWFTEALDLSRQLGDDHREAQVHRRLATLHEQQHDLDGAITELRTALATFERLRDDQCAARTRASLGGVLLLRGERSAARHVFLEALTIVRRLGDPNLTRQTTAQLAQCGNA